MGECVCRPTEIAHTRQQRLPPFLFQFQFLHSRPSVRPLVSPLPPPPHIPELTVSHVSCGITLSLPVYLPACQFVITHPIIGGGKIELHPIDTTYPCTRSTGPVTKTTISKKFTHILPWY